MEKFLDCKKVTWLWKSSSMKENLPSYQQKTNRSNNFENKC